MFFKLEGRVEIVIQRDFQVRMAQNFAEGFGIHANSNAAGGKGMAESMKIQIPKSGPCQAALVLVLKGAGFHGGFGTVCQHEVLRTGAVLVIAEPWKEKGWDGDEAVGGTAFGFGQKEKGLLMLLGRSGNREALNGAADLEKAFVCIDIFPSERTDLSQAQSGIKAEIDGCGGDIHVGFQV